MLFCHSLLVPGCCTRVTRPAPPRVSARIAIVAHRIITVRAVQRGRGEKSPRRTSMSGWAVRWCGCCPCDGGCPGRDGPPPALGPPRPPVGGPFCDEARPERLVSTRSVHEEKREREKRRTVGPTGSNRAPCGAPMGGRYPSPPHLRPPPPAPPPPTMSFPGPNLSRNRG